MDKIRLLKKAYKYLNTSTPLKFDCGRLCDKACCKGDSNKGMYLYPGEESMPGIDDFMLKYVDRSILLAVCDGYCERINRPLSCRIFPLVPIIGENNKLIIKVDPRAKIICPVAIESKISPVYKRKVRKVFELLAQDEDIKEFMAVMTDEISTYEKFIF